MRRRDGRRARRLQRAADSRSLILDAAREGLVRDGFRGTTTVTIEARAGVSHGSGCCAGCWTWTRRPAPPRPPARPGPRRRPWS
ncbi:helix-turn-helix transcriptional regulator [Pseudonocardia sp. KRD-169]|uniref:Helix-turn-helix transcriptional regulator n=1 Tax=Pseudonocardia abyssalis TaxID=2792008 RepID=A0ABS6UXQ7_9PSEU|nr:helix-turn-helix transcriptional regulator [Pseudonocardia abyssalis]MBW0136952.1 helix-turn-helix transcriptional regulator [Pseudonocardia abyssalis]